MLTFFILLYLATCVNYTYDNQNRYTMAIEDVYSTVTSTNSQEKLLNSDTTYYAYTSNTVTVTHQKGITTYYLNTAVTLADSAYWTITYAPGQAGTQVFKYFYDANSYLIKKDNCILSNGQDSLLSEDIFTITNGNYVLDVNLIDNSSTPFTFTGQTTATAPFPLNAFTIANYGNGITGHPNVNLTATLYDSLPSGAFNQTYTYTFDSKSRIIFIHLNSA